jgi:hypothetical protein
MTVHENSLDDDDKKNSLRAVRSFKYNENRNHLIYEIKEF